MSATPFSVYEINPFKFTLSIFSLFHKMFPCPSLFYEIIPLTLLCSSGIFPPSVLWDISPSFPIYEIFPRYVLWDIFPYFSHLWDISTICSMIYSPLLFISVKYFHHLFYDIFSPTFPIYEIFPLLFLSMRYFHHLFYDIFPLLFPSLRYFPICSMRCFPLLFLSMRYFSHLFYEIFPLLFLSIRYFPICSMRCFPYISHLWNISPICSMSYFPFSSHLWDTCVYLSSLRYYPFCPCLLLNLSPISGRRVCRCKILIKKASSGLDDISTFSI